MPPDFVLAQMQAVARDLEVDAIKIGMLATSAVIEAVAEGLKEFAGVPVVLDPVMIAASGDPLLDPGGHRYAPLRAAAARDAHHAESCRGRTLLATSPARSEDEMAMQAWQLKDAGRESRADQRRPRRRPNRDRLLLDRDRACELRGAARRHPQHHGTGCTLSSAIAAELAKGASLCEAVATAKAYVTAAIVAAD